MAGELLMKYYKEYFANCQPEIKKQEEQIEEIITKNPFLLAEEIFADVSPTVDSNKFYAISLVGSQGGGKTFSATEFATLAQREGYLVIYGKAEDILVDLQGWIDKVKELILEHNDPRVCFVLDDMSYSSGTISTKAAAKFKHFVADIRHVFKKVLGTIQILMIYISHRYHSLPPMLRNSGSWIFASMLNEDRADALKLIPNQKEQKTILESIYVFLSKVTQDGPKHTNLSFTYGGTEFNFKWGRQEDPGDGRLMMCFHHGELRIFNPKKIENMIDLEEHRILYEPPSEPTEEELELQKELQKEAFRKKAIEITSKLNKTGKFEIVEEF